MIKSITVVNTAKGWAVRQRDTDGSERFVFAESRFTLHQAQYAADSLRRHISNGGESYAEPLTDGAGETK